METRKGRAEFLKLKAYRNKETNQIFELAERRIKHRVIGLPLV